MINLFLRQLHLPAWAVFAAWFGIYIFWAGWIMINGYAQEYLGWRHPGRPGKMHKVVYRWHTGMFVRPDKTYGDERYLRKTAGANSRATPEGLIVHWTPYKRWHRAARNNGITVAILLVLSGMAVNPQATLAVIIVLLLAGIAAPAAFLIVRKRSEYQARKPKQKPAIAKTAKAKEVIKASPVTEEEKKPQLDGAPQNVIATILGGEMGCSTAELLNRLTMTPERGRLVLPDSFAAKARQREPVEEVIAAHTSGPVRFSWNTTATPRDLTWVPITIHKLPDTVRFREYLPQLQALGRREFGIGVTADRSMLAFSHNGDNPWWCRFAGSGTGKSMAFMVKAAQICHNDPAAELYCIDTKQVSFEHLHGIPRVYIFDNPVSEMVRIYKVFYTLAGIMRDRYSAIREGRARPEDFHDIWVLVDEGNDLGATMKSYWRNALGESSATPAVWGECIGPLLRQGRQARIFGEWMFQDLRDQAMGGESLKMAFNTFGAAGFLPQQFTRTIGNPAEDCIEGPGKILMCRGKNRTWAQGFYDDEQWLRGYALENRKEAAA